MWGHIGKRRSAGPARAIPKPEPSMLMLGSQKNVLYIILNSFNLEAISGSSARKTPGPVTACVSLAGCPEWVS